MGSRSLPSCLSSLQPKARPQPDERQRPDRKQKRFLLLHSLQPSPQRVPILAAPLRQGGEVDSYFGASNSSDIPIAARASFMVSPADCRARSEPASRISQASRGFSSNFFLRSCIGFSNSTSASAAQLLHSMQPMPAVRQPSFTLAMVSLLLKILCRSPTGHTSGFPGSDRRTR